MKYHTVGKNGRLYKRKYPLPEVGDRYGSWMIQAVSDKTHRYKKIFVCLCDCGTVREVKEQHLCDGKSTSCGCVVSPRHKPGEKFGRLTLVKHIQKSMRGDFRQGCWLTKCDCGNEKIIEIGHLTSANTRSCGCLKEDVLQQKSNPESSIWQGHGEIPLGLWSRYIRNAETRDIEFDIDIEYGWELFLKQKRKCSLSGCVLRLSSKNHCKDSTASLDRIDSKKGYVKGNVQWVHKTIQLMKWSYSQDHFIKLCKVVADHSET